MKTMLNVALPKGRLGEKVYAMFEKAGFPCPSIKENNRKLIFENEECGVRYFWVKPSDVAIYVERGAADIGVAGENYYRSKGRDIDIIHLNGSIEIAPILGLSDVIVDIVETGTTLKENDLLVYDTIVPISARLISNKASHKFKGAQIDSLVNSIRTQLEEAK